jgi:hypothetical protein
MPSMWGDPSPASDSMWPVQLAIHGPEKIQKKMMFFQPN